MNAENTINYAQKHGQRRDLHFEAVIEHFWNIIVHPCAF